MLWKVCWRWRRKLAWYPLATVIYRYYFYQYILAPLPLPVLIRSSVIYMMVMMFFMFFIFFMFVFVVCDGHFVWLSWCLSCVCLMLIVLVGVFVLLLHRRGEADIFVGSHDYPWFIPLLWTWSLPSSSPLPPSCRSSQIPSDRGACNPFGGAGVWEKLGGHAWCMSARPRYESNSSLFFSFSPPLFLVFFLLWFFDSDSSLLLLVQGYSLSKNLEVLKAKAIWARRCRIFKKGEGAYKGDFGPYLLWKAEKTALRRGHKEGRCNSLTQGQIPSKRSSVAYANGGWYGNWSCFMQKLLCV